MDRYVEELEPVHRGTDNLFNLGGHTVNGYDEGNLLFIWFKVLTSIYKYTS
jgi:hypothetical protein